MGGDLPGRIAALDDQVRAGLISQGATASLPVHPTQLYSAIDGLILLILLSAYYPLRRRDGEVMGLLMVAYPITRFLIEYLRNDEAVFVAGMTISQAISVGSSSGTVVYWAWLGTLPRRPQSPTIGDSESLAGDPVEARA